MGPMRIIRRVLSVLFLQVLLVLSILNDANSGKSGSSMIASHKQSNTVTLRARLAADLGTQNYGALRFSPNGSLLATGSDTRPAKLWDVSTGQLRYTLSAHKASIRLMFAPDGRTLATSGDKRVALWDTETGKIKHTLTGSSGLLFGLTYWVDFSPDGRLLLASGSDSKARLYETTNGQLRAMFKCRKGWMFAAFSLEGQQIATSCNEDNTAKLWSTLTGHLLAELSGHRAGITRILFSNDKQTVATQSLDDTVRLWDAKKGTLKAVLTGHRSTIYDSEFSPNGRWLATAGRDGTARLWDVQTGTLKYTLKGFDGFALRVAFSPNSRILAASGGYKHHQAKLLDIDAERVIATLDEHRNDIQELVFNQKGDLIITASKESARVWSSETGVLLAVLENARYPVRFSPDGKTLATVSVDKDVLLWDLP